MYQEKSMYPIDKESVELLLYVYIETSRISYERRAIITNFFRKIVHRYASDSCTIGIPKSTERSFSTKYNRLFFTLFSTNGTNIVNALTYIPWMSRKSMSAIEYALVDDQINSWLATRETEPMISSNLSDQRPHFTDCFDE